MVEKESNTVIVEDRSRGSYGWVIALGVIILLAFLFFYFGGANLFNGGGAETINVDTPDTINVQGQ